MHNSKFIIMITTVYSIYCCTQLVYLSTCLLVNLFTCQLVKVPLLLCLLLKQLVYSSTCSLVNLKDSFTRQLVYIVRNKGNEKKQNRKCLYSKYLIMGIGNGKKKGYNRYFFFM